MDRDLRNIIVNLKSKAKIDIYSFSNHLAASYVQGAILGVGSKAENRANKAPALRILRSREKVSVKVAQSCPGLTFL